MREFVGSSRPMTSRQRSLVVMSGLFLALAGCAAGPEAQSSPTVPSGAASLAPSGRPGVVTVIAAGDIAASEDEARPTADLVEELGPDFVLGLGDGAYSDGTAEQYAEKYDPAWGRFKTITRPVPGNHDYQTPDAKGYFGYFAAQINGRSYYGWDAGAWRLYALNCEIACAKGSTQERWLRADLAAHPSQPALAYVHRPRFTCSTKHEPFLGLTAIWDDLANSTGRLMLAGHNHAYERFAPMNGSGQRTAQGVRQFVVGTGGAESYPLDEPCPNREAGDDTDTGVLQLELRPDGYSWSFIGVDGTPNGKIVDAGAQKF